MAALNIIFRYNDIYDINKNKYVQSKWLNLPINKSKFILKGLLDTDGTVDKRNGTVSLSTTSEILAKQVQEIA